MALSALRITDGTRQRKSNPPAPPRHRGRPRLVFQQQLPEPRITRKLTLTIMQVLELPYGRFRIDLEGRIVAFSDLSGRDAAARNLLGRQLFSEILPWAYELEQRFLDLRREPSSIRVHCLDRMVVFPEGAWRISLILAPSSHHGQYYVCLQRRTTLQTTPTLIRPT